jgi:hypothetical protein
LFAFVALFTGAVTLRFPLFGLVAVHTHHRYVFRWVAVFVCCAGCLPLLFGCCSQYGC